MNSLKCEEKCYILIRIISRKLLSYLAKKGLKVHEMAKDIYLVSENLEVLKQLEKKGIFLQNISISWPIMKYIIKKSMKKGWKIWRHITLAEDITIYLDQYLEREDIEGYIGFLDSNILNAAALYSILLKKNKKEVKINTSGEVCFINGRFPEDFLDILKVLKEAISNFLISELRISRIMKRH